MKLNHKFHSQFPVTFHLFTFRVIRHEI